MMENNSAAPALLTFSSALWSTYGKIAAVNAEGEFSDAAVRLDEFRDEVICEQDARYE